MRDAVVGAIELKRTRASPSMSVSAFTTSAIVRLPSRGQRVAAREEAILKDGRLGLVQPAAQRFERDCVQRDAPGMR